MQQDQFSGKGGTYNLEADGKRTRVEEPTLGAVRSLYQSAAQGQSVSADYAIDLEQILTGTAIEVIAVLPRLSPTQLVELASLENAGKARKTVLDALAAIPAVAQP